MSDCPFFEPVHTPPEYDDWAAAKCNASGKEEQAPTDCPSGYKDECWRFHSARAKAAEGVMSALVTRLQQIDELAEAGKVECVYCCGVWTHTTLALADDGAYAALGLPEKAPPGLDLSGASSDS